MKKSQSTSIGAVLLGAIFVGVGAWALYHNYSPGGDTSATATATAATASSPAIDNGAPWKDGAAEYRAKLALAVGKIDEQNPLRTYIPTAGPAGRMALETTYSKGIAATPDSALLVLRLLKSGQLSTDEKIAMTSILSALYNRENTTGVNLEIALELKNLAADPNKQLAAYAAMDYARLEYLPDTQYVLKKALDNDALSSESYFRELAHLIMSAPPDKQNELLAEIRESSNGLASYILANAINSGQDYNAAPFLKSSEDMAKLLQTTEPQFDIAVGKYGIESIQYLEWIRASAQIENQRTGRNVDDFIIGKLSEPGTDPRKILAYLSSPYAMPLLATAAPGSEVQKLAAIARLPSIQNPGNTELADLAAQIEARMTNPPPPISKPVFTPPPELLPPTRPAASSPPK